MLEPIPRNSTLHHSSLITSLYQTTATTAETVEEGGGVLENELSVDAKLDYLVWLHFAEIEERVRKVEGV